MSYAGAGSGNTQTEDERRAEASRILDILEEVDLDTVKPNERDFLEKQFANQRQFVSVKQLWWLRDLKARYAE
jgi:hypothetical protein